MCNLTQKNGIKNKVTSNIPLTYTTRNGKSEQKHFLILLQVPNYTVRDRLNSEGNDSIYLKRKD